jgi:hypothetical protein
VPAPAPHEHDYPNNLAFGLHLLVDDPEAAERARQDLAECADCAVDLQELREVSNRLESVPREFWLEGPPDADFPATPDRPDDSPFQQALRQVRAEEQAGLPGTPAEHHPGASDPEPASAVAPAELAGPDDASIPLIARPEQVEATGPAAPAATGASAGPPEPPRTVDPGDPAEPDGPIAGVVPLRQRRRRPVAWLVAAAVVLLAVAGGVAAGRLSAPPPTVVVAQPGTDTPAGSREFRGRAGAVTMTAVLTPADGWVRVSAGTTGITPGRPCQIVVRAADGTEHIAGSWVIPPNGEPLDTAVQGSVIVDPRTVTAVIIRDAVTGEDVVSARA